MRRVWVGRDNFTAYCAPCHGRDGTGDGPVSPVLKTRPTDLTTLSRRAGGTFPAARMERFVTSGSPQVRAHGSTEMPVWGPTFLALEPSDTRVKIRIANVVSYIESIQIK